MTATRVQGSLVVGCDGRRSGTAARAGIKRTGWDYGQTALVCAIEHDLPHHGIAHQFFMPPGPLAILPLTGNRSSIVWSERTETAPRINACPRPSTCRFCARAFGDFLGDIRLQGDRFTYPLNLTIANSFISDRLALVGDAAHGMHPIAGQGLNAGLRDVGALAEVLTLAGRRGEDIGSPLVLLSAIRNGGGSTQPRLRWRRMCSTSCFPTTIRCCGSVAISEWGSSDPARICAAASCARPPV